MPTIFSRVRLWQASVCIFSFLTVLVTAIVCSFRRQIDLEVYRFAGRQLMHGTSLYLPSNTPSKLVFTYPPFASAILSPLSLMSYGLSKIVTTTATILCIALIVTLCIRQVFPETSLQPYTYLMTSWWWWSAVALAVVSEPVRSNLGFGQVNVYLATLIVLDVMYLRHTRWHGVLIGIAAAIKLTPAIFILYLLVTKRYKPALIATATAAVATATAHLAFSSDSLDYWSKWIFDTSRVGKMSIVSNQAISGIFSRIAPGSPMTAIIRLSIASVIIAAAVYIARIWSQRGHELAAVSWIALAGLLVSPISWSHHWVWWICIVFSLIQLARQRSWCMWLVGIWFVMFMVGPMWFVPHQHPAAIPWNPFFLVVGSSYCGLALVTLVLVTVALFRLPNSDNDVDRKIVDGSIILTPATAVSQP